MTEPIFHPQAEEEMVRAADYYQQQRTGLGDRFVRAVHQSVQGIAENPDLGTKLTPSIRRRIVPRYPFSVVYETEPDLRILAVMHQRRRPGYWRDRARGSE